ncbi:hypothetical protein F2Q69_00015098 [Brassica cretica]|uniref:Uncharacterized protein n=1 Tax=Brassica cretica TaxID=69181 RepID=A0A8S9QYC8_BRACR|nr:hypothetical protein F2Q69_00015098 [Brassica cretica]
MQVVDETRTDTMKRKVLCGTVLTSCCALVDEEQSAQSINQFVKLAPVTKEKILMLKNNPKWDSVKPLIKSFFRSTIRLVKQAADLEITVFLRLPNLEISVDLWPFYMTAIFQRKIHNNVSSSLEILHIPKPFYMTVLSRYAEVLYQGLCFHYTTCQVIEDGYESMTTKNKEAVEKIHSGHYTNCLDLWVIFIGANVQDYDLQPLLYTMIQIIN